MNRIWLAVAAAALLLGPQAPTASASGRGSISFGLYLGGPAYPRPWYPGPPWGYAYYRPYPVYVAPVVVRPAPVVLEPVPVVVQPSPVAPATSAIPASSVPTAAPAVSQTVGGEDLQLRNVEGNLQLLRHKDERVRSEAALQLGRLKAQSAVDQLTDVLARDSSPTVREAAARALGLIGSPRALDALRYAGQADSDRDVRRSAQFALEVITTNLRR